MDMMSIRRRLLEVGAPVPSGLGEFTKAYVYTGYPSNSTSWTIYHNMGVAPKIIFVHAEDEPDVNMAVNGIFIWSVFEPDNQNLKAGTYYFNSNASNTTAWFAVYTSDAEKVVIPVLYSNARSPYPTTKRYTVEMYA